MKQLFLILFLINNLFSSCTLNTSTNSPMYLCWTPCTTSILSINDIIQSNYVKIKSKLTTIKTLNKKQKEHNKNILELSTSLLNLVKKTTMTNKQIDYQIKKNLSLQKIKAQLEMLKVK